MQRATDLVAFELAEVERFCTMPRRRRPRRHESRSLTAVSGWSSARSCFMRPMATGLTNPDDFG
jgi:hypothetical protein